MPTEPLLPDVAKASLPLGSTFTAGNSSPTRAEKRPRRRLPLWKRALFTLMALGLSWIAIEFVSWMALCSNYGTLEHVRDGLDRQAKSSTIQGVGRDPNKDDRDAFPEEIIHPYLGYVRRPAQSADTAQGVSEFGFAGQLSPVRRKVPGQVLVAITGGSVAEFFAAEGGDHFCTLLEQWPRFAGKKVVLVPLGLLSYKQPQQLLALNYLLALGAEFDVVINLDGFNEIVLPPTFNTPNGVFASYPREWHLRVTRAADLETLRLIGRVTYLRDSATRWAVRFANPPWRFSPTALLVWQRLHDGIQREATLHYKALNARLSENLDADATGPRQNFASDDELHRHCVDVWKRSSQQMHDVCRAHGIAYYHFLQPNQYLPGSKPMDAAERAAALSGNHSAKPHVEQGYPLLIAAGAELRQKSVRFHDLSQIFAQTRTQVYRDTCCHLNAEGNRILAEAMVQVIANE